ncbi:MAG: alpha-L-fucosidase, partial [Bryobacteraceae bacterium]
PRSPAREIVLDDIQAPSGTQITLLQTGEAVRWSAAGNGLRITAPDAAGTTLPFAEAYVLKIPGAR